MAKTRFYGVKNHPDAGKNGIYDSWDQCSEVVKGAKGVQYKGFGSYDEAQAFCDEGTEVKPVTKSKAEMIQETAAYKADNVSLGAGSLAFDARKAMDSLNYLRDCELMDDKAYDAVRKSINQKSIGYTDWGKEHVNDEHLGTDPSRGKIGLEVYVDGSYNDRSGRAGFGVYILGYGVNMRGKGPETVMYGSVPTVDGGRNVEGEVTAARIALENIQALGTNKPVTIYHDYEGIGKWADGDWRANKSYTRSYAAMVNDMRRFGMDIRFEHVAGHTEVYGNEMVDRLAKMGCGVHFPNEKAFMDDIHKITGADRNIMMDRPPHEQNNPVQQMTHDDTGIDF